jgi:hypothetical protein
MIRALVLLLLLSFLLAGTVAAQPDRSAALEKAKAKFEKDMTKYDETLLAGIDKSIAQATKAGNKALKEKLTYEREVFVKSHIVPTAYPPDNYLHQRSQALTALQAVYNPAINELTKAKKFAEAAAIEDSLNDILKASRGYGLPFPDLDAQQQPVFLIENKSSGLVIDSDNNKGYGELVLVAKVGRRKPSQCWMLEREEKGVLFRNVQSKHCIDVKAGNTNAGTILNTWPVDRKKETNATSLFQVAEVRHEFVIECTVNSLVLTGTERKAKGVTTTYLTQEKKEGSPSPTQLWKVVEAK